MRSLLLFFFSLCNTFLAARWNETGGFPSFLSFFVPAGSKRVSPIFFSIGGESRFLFLVPRNKICISFSSVRPFAVRLHFFVWTPRREFSFSDSLQTMLTFLSLPPPPSSPCVPTDSRTFPPLSVRMRISFFFLCSLPQNEKSVPFSPHDLPMFPFSP